MWTVSFTAPRDDATAFVKALDDITLAVSQFEDSGGDPDTWRIGALFEHQPARADLIARLAVAGVRSVGSQIETPSPGFTIVPVPDTDWVAANLSSFSPMRIGRFWVHGFIIAARRRRAACRCKWMRRRPLAPVNTRPPMAVSWPWMIWPNDPHSSGWFVLTDRCLFSILAAARAFWPWPRVKNWSCAVLASDVDPEAVRVSRRVVRANGLHNIVRVIHADGVSHRSIRSQTPFVLITANILARPLRRLSADLAAVLAPGGCLVLSGLLQKQIPFVLNAYRTQGLRLERLYRLGEWATLVVRR